MSARSDPPASSKPTDRTSRARSGPADVSVALVVAARKGDPAAFAQMVEHWNVHLRPFVHHLLAGEGDTDRVLGATYVRAYRALPRYHGERTPGLWFHRIAYLAATDELRRVARDPVRRRAKANSGPLGNEAERAVGKEQEAVPPPADDVLPSQLDATGPELPINLDRLFGLPATPPPPDGRPAEPVTAAAPLDRAGRLPNGEPKPVPPPSPPTTIVGSRSAPSQVSDVVARPLASSGPSDPPGNSLSGSAARHPDPSHRTVVSSEDQSPSGTTPDGARAEPGPADRSQTVPLTRGPGDRFPSGWHQLAPDQRALAVLVDVEGFDIESAAATFDTTTSIVLDRLHATRRVLARSHPAGLGGAPSNNADDLAIAARAVLASVPVPPAEPAFWSMLGRRLLAERESPAAPAIDPIARLAQAHPAEPGFRPKRHLRRQPKEPTAASVSVLADQADWVRPARPWGRIVAIIATIAILIGLVFVAIRVGTSTRIPDGSIAAEDLANEVSAALAEGPYRDVQAAVEETDPAGKVTAQRYRIILASDGSWLISATDRIAQTTYSAATGTVRRVAVVDEASANSILANEENDLSAGPPDPAATAPSALADLQSIPIVLRSAGTMRAERKTTGDLSTFTLKRTLPTGMNGAAETWSIVVRRSDTLPIQVDRHNDDRLVRRIRFTDWKTSSTVAANTFEQPLPDGISPAVRTHGFMTTDLDAVPLLGRGQAATPAWLPTGYELTTITVRSEAPAGEPSTAEGTNPKDVAVLSLGFQRGPERLTITTRSTGTDAAKWKDPFPAGPSPTSGTKPGVSDAQRLGSGRFNGATVHTRADAWGRARMWGIDGDTVLTVSGDVTPAEALKVAGSLR
ncbi:MAG: hypothetical protein ABIP03_00325 [Aquihabitans sp.]